MLEHMKFSPNPLIPKTELYVLKKQGSILNDTVFNNEVQFQQFYPLRIHLR